MADILLVLYKPDGAGRVCTQEEIARIHEVWMAVLDWLRGGDLHVIPHADLVEEVARKASIRTPRHPTYDVALWAKQARTPLERRLLTDGDQVPLPDVCLQIFSSLSLERTDRQLGWLNLGSIDLIYGQVVEFQRHREALTKRLLSGPIIVERWIGPRKELALAMKTVVRRSLSAAAMTNLIHMDVATDSEFGDLVEAMSTP